LPQELRQAQATAVAKMAAHAAIFRKGVVVIE
jgi:hypothetical protein